MKTSNTRNNHEANGQVGLHTGRTAVEARDLQMERLAGQGKEVDAP